MDSFTHQLSPSEIIVNNDGSIYHLGLRPEEVCKTIITVGDPARVESIASYMDHIYFIKENREFKSMKARLGNKDLSVISTGIGTDNIDIVLNELAFLFFYDLQSRKFRGATEGINLFRVGTSGTISQDLSLDEVAYSRQAIGMEDLFMYYNHSFDTIVFEQAVLPIIDCSSKLAERFAGVPGVLTLTAKGFYGPQFRNSALKPKYELHEAIEKLSQGNKAPQNLEMETAGIYGLSKLLGFEAISVNAILADRIENKFSTHPEKTVKKAIELVLQRI